MPETGRITLTYPKLKVILPTLNEEEGIEATISELRDVLESFDLLVIDGCSEDRTCEIAKKMGGTVIKQNGCGKGDAIFKALRNVDGNPDYLIFIDADFTYPAKYLLKMIDVMENNPDVGMVIGNRFDQFLSFNHLNNRFYFGNRLLAIAQYLFNGIKLADPLTGLRLVRWSVFKNWMPKSKGFDIEAEMNYYVERQGFRIVEVPITYRNRLGEKKLKMRHGFKIMIRIISESLNAFID